MWPTAGLLIDPVPHVHDIYEASRHRHYIIQHKKTYLEEVDKHRQLHKVQRVDSLHDLQNLREGAGVGSVSRSSSGSWKFVIIPWTRFDTGVT